MNIYKYKDSETRNSLNHQEKRENKRTCANICVFYKIDTHHTKHIPNKC